MEWVLYMLVAVGCVLGLAGIYLLLEFWFWLDARRENRKHQHWNEIMSALENLTAAVTELTATIDKVVAEWQKPAPGETEVQAAADAVTAQNKRLNDMMTPPVTPSGAEDF